jgi:hypothetical protein
MTIEDLNSIKKVYDNAQQGVSNPADINRAYRIIYPVDDPKPIRIRMMLVNRWWLFMGRDMLRKQLEIVNTTQTATLPESVVIENPTHSEDTLLELPQVSIEVIGDKQLEIDKLQQELDSIEDTPENKKKRATIKLKLTLLNKKIYR